MVLKFAKELGFNTKEEYFQYIIESNLNGNKKQSRELYNNLLNDGMQGERASFWAWLKKTYCEEILNLDNEDTEIFLGNWKAFFAGR